MKLKLFTYFWGVNFRYLFENFCYPSVADQIAELKAAGVDVEWQVHTPVPMRERSQCTYYPAKPNETLETFQRMIEGFADTGIPVAFIGPDYIVGADTIANCFELIKDRPNQSIAVAHPRIAWEKFTSRWNTVLHPLQHEQLVSLAFQFPHRCLSGADPTVLPNLTWTGLSVREIKDGLFAVTHNLATPFICRFTKDDVKFFKDKHFESFDRDYTRKLLKEGRIKLVGSSDIAFFLELTSASHHPEMLNEMHGISMLNNDKEMDGQNHYNPFIVTWRM